MPVYDHGAFSPISTFNPGFSAASPVELPSPAPVVELEDSDKINTIATELPATQNEKLAALPVVHAVELPVTATT
jgi:hypothetical protein